MLVEFARITASVEAEPALTTLGITDELLQLAIRHADAEDAHIEDDSYDPIHRGVNRWGHALAFLRRELRRHGWDWNAEGKQQLRNVISPDRTIQVCVASAEWHDGSPRTLPKGCHTIDAVSDNNQLWLQLPDVELDSELVDAGAMTTLILCVGRVVRPAEDGRPREIRYRYELSAPDGMTGKGERRRVVSWRYRCFKGTVRCDRAAKPIKEEEWYDHESVEGMEGVLSRKP